ncbi:MAG: bifunctional precorrin-2 dehydrogenase/sirohydrochlorin ferrochelatase [Chloroflexi bacterium]|nr:bifunctional precorrin-2 dehydrogenase/sirohydrochlorin ferrochelatase [Chloroflexota bacterium]MCY3939436.1 bifunctional precorrin-2 dehydrogenase/sirohydrochlorin ferrochelatase [Chloroflexota bacterium]
MTEQPRRYPISLNLERLECVVVGAGRVGERKALGLVKAGATPLVVGPRAAPGVLELASSGEIRLLQLEYRPELLQDASLVFAATDDPALNARVAADARSVGALVNVADDPARSDFANVGEIASGGVRITVSTGGRSPAFARALRKRLQASLPVDLDVQLEHFERWRAEIESRIESPEDRRLVWTELENRDLHAILDRHGPAAANRLVSKCIHAALGENE